MTSPREAASTININSISMSTSGKFGTFGGVFTPSILTILGVIMYMRLPMIVGEAGLFGTLGIIIVAHIISATTGVSVSSIATDKKVQAGGTYYMISRSLGLPIGGTLGIALFVGLSFSVSLYLIGFSESFLGYWGFEVTKDAIRVAGTLILLIVTGITLISTSLAIKTQYVIMAAIALSLLSIFFGRHEFSPEMPLLQNPSSTVPLMVLFGIFFPAVTGFEAGVSMSGDLRDPKKSIPGGSLLAIAMGFMVYLGLVVFLATTVQRSVLIGDPQVLVKISLVPQLVIAGVWGATLSSALGSILGAPRILQATAADKITASFFARGSGRANEPRNAMLLTFVIAETGILIGELDIIARIVSIFFIITYGFLNLSCAFETWTSADFRPEFRAPIWVSLLGTVACVLVMIQLDFLAMIGGSILLGGLFVMLKRKELQLESGDTWNGVWSSLVKSGIDYLSKSKMHARNWRPNIIMFRGTKEQRSHLYELGNALAGRLGVLSSFELVDRSNSEQLRLEAVQDGEEGVHSFRHYCSDVYAGMREIIRMYGFSGMRPNTVLMGWSKNEKVRGGFSDFLRNAVDADMNVILLKHDAQRGFGKTTSIDLWWSGEGTNLAFAISVLRLVSTSAMWKTARMRLLLIDNEGVRSEKIHRSLRRILDEYRIAMDVEVINNSVEMLSAENIIGRESAETDLTVLGLPGPHSSQISERIESTHRLIGVLGSTMVIHGSSQFESLSAGLEKRKTDLEDLPELELPLPPILTSHSAIVTADLGKINENGERVLRLLFEKSIAPWVLEQREIIASIQSLARGVFESLDQMVKFKDNYRRRKTLLKTRNEYLFRCRQLVQVLQTETVPHQEAALRDSIRWYVERLELDIRRFPKKLRLQYPEEELKLRDGEGIAAASIKLWKRMIGSIARRPAQRTIPYREIATQYLVVTRHQFLQVFLTRFMQESAMSLSTIRSNIVGLANQLALMEQGRASREIRQEDLHIAEQKLLSALKELDKQYAQRGLLYRHRLMLEFRKNVIALRDELQHFDVAKSIASQEIPAKIQKQTVARNLQFAQVWAENTNLVVDKMMLDIAIAALRSRVHDRVDEFENHIVQQINSHLTAPMVKLGKTLNDGIMNKSAATIEFDFERSFELLDDLEDAHEDILEHTRALPERVFIVEEGTTNEPVEVPCVRLAQHYIESQLISPIQEAVNDATERLLKTAYTVKDQVNFARFSIENIDADLADKSASTAGICRSTLAHLNEEVTVIASIKDNLAIAINEALETTFDSLAPHKIVRSAQQFNRVLRDYKGRQVLTTFGEAGAKIRSLVQKKVTQLIYKHREGMLLAQRLSGPTRPATSDLRDVLDAVSPQPEVLKALPQFYINLFSGRSSIGAEFWINRAREEQAFTTAVGRYREGNHGAILVLGERNAGKTAFCRYVGARHFKKGHVFHIFPPREGSRERSVFAKTLGKAIGTSGAAEDLINALPHESIMFIHDLELWFERHAGGLDVLREIATCIEVRSHDVLFVVNTTSSAFELIRALVPLEDLVSANVTLLPMSTESLQEMIMLRHKSSGMALQLNGRSEMDLSDFARARLFDAYFKVSHGNPGIALSTWLACIERVNGKTIEIQRPELPSTQPLSHMPDDWLVYLTQIVLHKRITAEKLSRVTGSDCDEAQHIIRRLRSAGLLEERAPGVFMINSNVDHLVRNLLREGQMI